MVIVGWNVVKSTDQPDNFVDHNTIHNKETVGNCYELAGKAVFVQTLNAIDVFSLTHHATQILIRV